MITMERCLAMLVKDGKVAALEAEKWVDNISSFIDQMQHLGLDVASPPTGPQDNSKPK
jgi:hypothetical protein